ncbi:transcription antitermination factor NusB [Algoriphagus aestuariicola]|jgi:N utilization substance protein B|uniref:Transcription antitermination factor NusB n=1 Tax=Algoriphagus aestuariicola TaxID=1852016 RepID=A0ABS3BTZ0_9BACT|nr:transcription antitermination factor NusB [Algoriphagus aestuariicola]MBN7802706.1 transcription antitermination factor NusB [Algoriphagus aestuariicola]
MLNRRILRVKAFQNLYAFEQCKGSNLNIAKDFIRESFLPDLNSMEVQDKPALTRDAEEAVKLFDQNLENESLLKSSDAKPKIKQIVLQALKQFHTANEKDRDFMLRNMITSAERIPQLYLLAIELLQAFAKHVEKEIEKKKRLAGDSPVAFTNELNLANNQILKNIRESQAYQAAIARNNVNLDDLELEIREWFRDYIKTSEPYQEYLKIAEPTIEQDFEAADDLLKKVIFKNEVILNYFSEKDLNWTENKSVVRSLASKVLKNAAGSEESEGDQLPEIAINWDEDKEFFQNIFNFTIENEGMSKSLIAQKTKNWDIDRLAFTDKIIISMAIAEMKHFPSIPVKVSINEYIDISKTYSTPKSKQFVNGLLDVLAKELTDSGQIRKSGRGLLDNK